MVQRYPKMHVVLTALGGLILLLTGCGFQSASPPVNGSWPTIRIHLDHVTPLATLPLTLAQRLGIFQQIHLRVVYSNAPDSTELVGGLRNPLPVVGYLATRPDMVLLSPLPDPHFRLRALAHLPIFYSPAVTPQLPLLETVLKIHRAAVTDWTQVPFTRIKALWQRHHLPWVVVTLAEAQTLSKIDNRTITLTWLGASTGPIPSVVIQSQQKQAALARFLSGLNLALWYLHTTPSATIASVLSSGHPNSLLAHQIRQAIHYQYWPVTTFPDSSTYRRMASLALHWPAYHLQVNTLPALQALSEMDK